MFPLPPYTVDTESFQDFSLAQRNCILGHASTANSRIVLDSKQEAGHESRDEVWQCWTSYCALAGLVNNTFLIGLPEDANHLLLHSFFSLYHTAKWSVSGDLESRHSEPLVASTLRGAASCLAASFWHIFQPSPLHISGSQNTHPQIKALFRAFDNVDAPTRRKKSITPKLLRKLLSAAGPAALVDTAPAVVADIVIGAYFFAMRSCEYSKPQTAGHTQCVNLAGLVFCTASNTIMEHADLGLLTLSEFITVTFINQKNGQKMDSWTQRCTGDPHLCPMIRYTRQVQRIPRTVPDASGSTTINTIALDGRIGLITNTYILNIVRNTC
jgi:hypothetical protein